jgi:hypothetical protein
VTPTDGANGATVGLSTIGVACLIFVGLWLVFLI